MTPVFIIAEAGVNHNGSAERALQMVDTAARCGADAIKFQTFSADRLVTRDAPKAAYQKANTGEGNQYDMLRALELDEGLHRQLFARCGEKGIEFMSTPFDEQAADFLAHLGMRRFKIPSGEITNLPYLRHIAAKGAAMILSTGMATMGEIEDAVAAIEEVSPHGKDVNLTILHCTSNYPAEPEELNLRAMQAIAEATGRPVGYSDHSNGSVAAIACTALGATVIEKHFTEDSSLPGPDHKASLEPDEFESFVREVRTAETMLGSSDKGPTHSEIQTRLIVRRSITLAKSLTQGEAVTREHLILMRPGSGVAPKHLDALIGQKAKRDLRAGTQPTNEDFTD